MQHMMTLFDHDDVPSSKVGIAPEPTRESVLSSIKERGNFRLTSNDAENDVVQALLAENELIITVDAPGWYEVRLNPLAYAIEPMSVDLTQEILAKALDTIEAQAAVISAQKAEIDALKAHLPEEGTEGVELRMTEAEQKFMRGLQKWEWMMVYYTDVNRCDIVSRLEARGLVQVDRAPATYMNITLPSAKGE
jgi:hypothetical protein